MTSLMTLALAVLLTGLAQDAKPADTKPVRKPHPLAPSLPELTDEEEDKLDDIINRFILFDTGRLPGQEGAKAKQEFDKLGPEATFALIRGLNKAAAIEHSCPVVVIAKKLNKILGSTNDAELLEFARENIGAGVGRTRHTVILKDLRLACAVRKNLLAQNAVAAAKAQAGKATKTMSVTELTEAAGSERGQRLKDVLIELEQRKGNEVIVALGTAAGSYEGEVQQLARDLLVRHLTRQEITVVKEKFKDERPEVRKAAIVVASTRDVRLATDLIDLLADSDANVRTTARQALVRLSRGVDLGPTANAGKAEQDAAIKKWREWWARQGIR